MTVLIMKNSLKCQTGTSSSNHHLIVPCKVKAHATLYLISKSMHEPQLSFSHPRARNSAHAIMTVPSVADNSSVRDGIYTGCALTYDNLRARESILDSPGFAFSTSFLLRLLPRSSDGLSGGINQPRDLNKCERGRRRRRRRR